MATKPKSALVRKRAASVAPPMTTDGCVITYFFNGRAFQRLFMESDIEAMKNVVRKKLDIPASTALSLAQLVDDQRIDLEDDADFSAFKFGTEIKPEMYVEVSIASQPAAQLASPSVTSPSLNFEQAPAEPVASSSNEPAAAPAKAKRAKKASAPPTAADSAPEQPPAPKAQPTLKKGADPVAPVEAPVPSTSTTAQPKHKKRARKSAAEDGATTTVPTVSSTANPPPIVDEPPTDPAPPKKKRKSKAEITLSLPPPGPSQRKPNAAQKPVSTAAPAAGSNADILKRWVVESEKPAPAAPAEPKKRKKKAKELAPPRDDSEPSYCEVCTKAHSGSGFPLSCPLLTRHDAGAVALVEKRVEDLVANQGPDRAGQMTISALRRWLKEQAKEDEALDAPAPTVSESAPKAKKAKAAKASKEPLAPVSVATIPFQAVPPNDPPRPIIPKKSKLSEVAVSRQEERSSSDDEDIVKSVIQSNVESDAETEGDEVPEEQAAAPVVERALTPPPKVSAPILSVPRVAASSAPIASSTPRVPALPNPSGSVVPQGRMSRPAVLALLDDLENEETKGEQEDEDGEGSELAESTPSDVARKRHRKSVRIGRDDSDAGEDGDGDVEMGEADGIEVGANKPELTLSQVLESSQPLEEEDEPPQPIALDRDEQAKPDDDIEEYESDNASKDVAAVPGSGSSPIERAEASDAEPAEKQEEEDEQGEETPTPQGPRLKQSKKVGMEAEGEVTEVKELAAEEPTPALKKRGRPPLSQAAKEERAAERARIQAERASEGPKKRGRASLSKPVDEEPPAEESKAKKPRVSTNGNLSMSMEVSRPKTRAVSSSQATPFQAKSDAEGPDTVTPTKRRGRPPLSEAVRAEREAEKERLRAEKAIKKLEAKTARANTKRGKGKGSEEPEQLEEDIETADTTAGDEMDVTIHEESHPEWAVMEDPQTSSARDHSSQVDEIEYGLLASQKSTKTRNMQPKSIARSMLPKRVPEEDDAEYQSTSKNLARPLFNPSSGLVKIGSHPGPQPDSSPIIPVKATNGFSLSQPTPSIRRRASALPRFTDIKAQHDLLRQQRRASQLSSVGQSKTQTQLSQTNGSQEVLVIEESSSDENSSGDEGANAAVTPSQKKRKSVLAYFSQG